MMSDLMAAAIGAVVTVAVAMLAFVQWRVSHEHQVRQRDAELMRWGREVISLMSELEHHCAPIGESNRNLNRERVEALAAMSSALVDEGRLFFSNVAHAAAPTRSPALRAFSGYRPVILDEVLRAHYVARYLVMNGQARGAQMRQQVWSARGRFVSHLQSEMGPSVKRTPEADIGEELDQDPTTWPIDVDREHLDPSARLAADRGD